MKLMRDELAPTNTASPSAKRRKPTRDASTTCPDQNTVGIRAAFATSALSTKSAAMPLRAFLETTPIKGKNNEPIAGIRIAASMRDESVIGTPSTAVSLPVYD